MDNNDIQVNNIKYWQEIKEYVKKSESKIKKSDISWILDYNFDELTISDFSHEVWNEKGEKIISDDKQSEV